MSPDGDVPRFVLTNCACCCAWTLRCCSACCASTRCRCPSVIWVGAKATDAPATEQKNTAASARLQCHQATYNLTLKEKNTSENKYKNTEKNALKITKRLTDQLQHVSISQKHAQNAVRISTQSTPRLRKKNVHCLQGCKNDLPKCSQSI